MLDQGASLKGHARTSYELYSLNSLKVGYIGDYTGDYDRGYKGDARSLDYSSYKSIPGILLWNLLK